MERLDHLDIRMSNSPRRSPLVTREIGSPVRSVHPDLLESLHSQVDFGHRTTDFFEDSSDSGEGELADHGSLPHTIDTRLESYPTRNRRSGNYLGCTTDEFRSNCAEKRASTPISPTDFDKYLRLVPDDPYHMEDGSRESSYVGSVDELTPSRPIRREDMHVITNHTHQRSPGSPNQTQGEESPILPKQSMANHIIKAHHMTMQALLGDDKASAPSPTPPQTSPNRTSKFPLDRSSRIRSASAPIKKVSVAPPPIDTSVIRNWPQEKAVKTPYPFRPIHRKEFGRQFSASEPALRSPRLSDSVLTLSIRRSNNNSRLRISTLTIPANSEFSVLTTTNRDKHFLGLDFDDAEFFRQLRVRYNEMLGPYRYLSARGLSSITISGSACRAADAGYGWLLTPRSPRVLASKGLSDTFSEDKMLKFFRKPREAGKSRYAWVSWAHRLAAATPPVTTPVPPASALRSPPPLPPTASSTPTNSRFSMIRRLEQHEGLEFVVSWSAKRILGVLACVVLLSVATTLLWVFLGQVSHTAVPAGGTTAGFKDAGDRVASGVLIGIAVLLVGLTGMTGWIGVSWLVL